MAARVARIRIYPFKALDGVEVDAAVLSARGGLHWDRVFAFVDNAGRFVNGKSDARVHTVAATYDARYETVMFRDRMSGEYGRCALSGKLEEPAVWMTARLGRPVRIARDDNGGFPDDTQAAGPTIVSTATLAVVASWFDGLDIESVRRRLRTNIEIDGVPPFWEDRLFGAVGDPLRFALGEVMLEATNPCARCVVPSRDPDTGATVSGFAKRIAEMRAATLPEWVNRARFDHFYRLAVNTRVAVAQTGGSIRVGDPVDALVEAPTV